LSLMAHTGVATVETAGAVSIALVVDALMTHAGVVAIVLVDGCSDNV
jgi:hypothetical protein